MLTSNIVNSGETEIIAAGGTSTALNLGVSNHLISADAGGDIFTLAAATKEGIQHFIYTNSATGTATITPTGLIGGTSITFNAAGDSVTLRSVKLTASTYGWAIVGGNSYAIV